MIKPILNCQNILKSGFCQKLRSFSFRLRKTICELLCELTGFEKSWERSFEILWERDFEEEEDSPFSDLETSWEVIPEGESPKILESSEAGGFMVAWIALRSSGVQEIDSTHCWIWRALEDSTLLWSWLTISNPDFIGFSAERGRETLSVTSLFVSIFSLSFFLRGIFICFVKILLSKNLAENFHFL